jgi:hypothetical protein
VLRTLIISSVFSGCVFSGFFRGIHAKLRHEISRLPPGTATMTNLFRILKSNLLGQDSSAALALLFVGGLPA